MVLPQTALAEEERIKVRAITVGRCGTVSDEAFAMVHFQVPLMGSTSFRAVRRDVKGLTQPFPSPPECCPNFGLDVPPETRGPAAVN